MAMILVVEDDATSQVRMTEFLETLGYSCCVVSNGEECLGLLAEQPDAFDLVLINIQMTGSAGLEISSAIRRNWQNPARPIPIFAVTSDTSCLLGEGLRSHGIDAVLAKPVDLSMLDTAIERFAA